MSQSLLQTQIFLSLSVQILTHEISFSWYPPMPGLHFMSVQESFSSEVSALVLGYG